jgi:large subunit ribosomal protein L13
MIIDANNTILGRLGTYAAKKAMLGEKVDIVNCEGAVITGNVSRILADYRKFLERGTHAKGPFTYRMPDKFVKRSIRGMLPYKKERGKMAFANIKCYIGVPSNLKDQKMDSIKGAQLEKLPNLKYTTVKNVCMHIGAKI